jgi:hypothetical protein
MDKSSRTNSRTPSATWAWRRVKIASAPQGPTTRDAKHRRWYHLRQRDPREWLTITVKYRGGAEAWYEVSARGERGRFPGHRCLHDVMTEINQGHPDKR